VDKNNILKKCRTHNERFCEMAAVTRRQFCGKLNVITPQQVQWKPPLPQAASTLCVSNESIIEKIFCFE
jgi:hypothetical protein